MSFSQTRFLGASIMSFTASVGWNEVSSTMTITLVEDFKAGDSFARPNVGTPVQFEFDGFVFHGLVQRWWEKNAFDGKPTFEVTLTDPRELLAGTQVIISSYRGNIGPFANVLNAFGYWEDELGFGGSLNNESGMLWNAPFETLNLNLNFGITVTPAGHVGILPAIQAMTAGTTDGRFGGPLRYFGYSYAVDLSGLPNPPTYYRFGGNVSVNLMDVISELCQDGGCDFICYLDGNVIRFKTVSRAAQPDPGQIANFINSQTNASSNGVGYELRNDITNAFLVGGDVTTINQIYNINQDMTIWPFWDFDPAGNVIVGQGQPEVFHEVYLNASPIADILGEVTYYCTLQEMRCALIDFDSWSAYVLKSEPNKAAVINLVSAIDSGTDLAEIFPDTLFQHDIISANDEAVYEFGRMNESDYWTQRVQRVFEFVRTYASEYFGRKFLVRIPFSLYWSIEPETTHRISSDEPTDAGFLPEGSMPLGLGFLNEYAFLTPDGRYQCFVAFDSSVGIDVQKFPGDAWVLQGNTLYMRAQIDLDIGVVYPPGSIYPYCVVNLEAPAYSLAPDPLGGVEEIATILGVDPATITYAAGIRHGSFPMKIHPPPRRPDAIALPMKSNRDCYGPWWSTAGVDGKVSFERDEGLVPWNYGDYSTMNQAAMAKLQNMATAQQYIETGTIEVAGSPALTLGDALVAGGPEVTGIDVQFNTSGVMTTYRMQTYTTPRFGLHPFTKDSADRLRRLGMAAQEMRRAIRYLFQRREQLNNLAAATQWGFMANTSRAVAQATPHQCLLGSMTFDSTYGYRTHVSSETPQEFIANVRGDDPDVWIGMAGMTMEGLLRPFSTNWQRIPDDPANDMPHYEKIDNLLIPAGTPAMDTLDPFGDFCDVDYMVYGDEYPGEIHGLKQAPDFSNARLLGLRGPIVMIGWGYSYTGKPVPNARDTDVNGISLGENDWSTNFVANHRQHPETWKAGPIGLFWDNWRKVWTIPTFVFGQLTVLPDPAEDTPGQLQLDFQIFGGPPDPNLPAPDLVDVYDIFNGKYKVGGMVCAAYHQQKNRWIIIAAGC